MELRQLLTEAIENYTGRRPASIEYYEDPNVEGVIAVRAMWQDAPQGADDYLVHYGIPGQGFIIEDVEFTTWPPTYSGGKAI